LFQTDCAKILYNIKHIKDLNLFRTHTREDQYISLFFLEIIVPSQSLWCYLSRLRLVLIKDFAKKIEFILNVRPSSYSRVRFLVLFWHWSMSALFHIQAPETDAHYLSGIGI